MPTFIIDFLMVLATLLVVGLMALMAWLAIILLAPLLGTPTGSPDRRIKNPRAVRPSHAARNPAFD